MRGLELEIAVAHRVVCVCLSRGGGAELWD